MNLLLWITRMEEAVGSELEKISKMGFDGIEAPVFDFNPDQWELWGRRRDELELDRVAVTFCGPEFNPISPDSGMKKNALERNQGIVVCAQALGSRLLTGPFHSALGVFTGQAATAQEWNWSVDHTRQMAETASHCGITLGIESLNRFENYLLTCTKDTIRYLNAVHHSSSRMMFDTFHAHIEEKHLGDFIRAAFDYLVHVQIAENDRSTPGLRNVNWPDVFDALREINYDGLLSIEAFGHMPPDLASAAHIYRRMFENEEKLLKESLTFLRRSCALSANKF